MAVPGLAAALAAAVVLWLATRKPGRAGRGAALALAIGFVAGRLLVRVPDAFPPTYGQDWILVLGLLAAVGAWTAGGATSPAVRRLVPSALLLVAGTYLLLRPLPGLEDRALRIGGYAAAGLLLTVALERLAGRGPRLLLVGGPALAAGAAGALFALETTANVGKTFVALSLAWAAVTVLTWRASARDVARASAAVFGPLYTFTFVVGIEYGYGVTFTAPAILLACPVLPWALEWTPLSRRPDWQRVAVGALVTAAAAAGALALVLGGGDDAASMYG